MKILRFFLFTTFLISILVGFLAGNLVFYKDQPTISESNPQPEISVLPGRQEGIWLIGVDQINKSTPQIKGIWLLTYITGYNKLKPLPFYPSNNNQKDAELEQTFQIDHNSFVSEDFWNKLQSRSQPVHDYIIFDEVAAAEMINYFGGVTIDGQHLDGNEIFKQSPEFQQQPQLRINRQIVIMSSLCNRIFSDHPVPDFATLQKKVASHILSNIDLGEQLTIYQKLIANGNHTVCEFPELNKKPTLSGLP